MDSGQVNVPVGGTVGFISSHLPGLVPAERRVAEVVVADPEFVSQGSAADVAERASTSPATVVRTFKSLGLVGFQNLRMMLVRDLAAAGAVGGREPSEATGVDRIVDTTVGDLPQALSTLDRAELAAAVSAVHGARRVLVAANGGSAPAAQLGAFLLIQNGRSVEAPADAVVQHMAAVSLGEGDVCIAVSNSGTNALTIEAADAARRSGAAIVSLTGYARSPLAQMATHALIAGPPVRDWAVGMPGIVAAQMVVLTALADGVVSARGGEHDFSPEIFRFIAEAVDGGVGSNEGTPESAPSA
ncbi:MurR/RpiR family transcriptional regulator [Demequina flava]|uniref:MurR/RpiR family transcriptional regulator n=1 Tax=Demequina flava TaxID=1095025 RepID=UPI0007866E18|nr:MurR/RpiR family transcriptional regulator [Demequina flava]